MREPLIQSDPMPGRLPAVSLARSRSEAGPLPGAAGCGLDAYRSEVYRLLRGKGFRPEEADDLTQETLIRAYVHLPRFRGSSLAPWLRRIATNLAIDWLRRRRLSVTTLDPALALPAADGDPTSALERSERRAEMQALIRELPECHQRVLRLRYYEDCSLSEIAGMMNCSPAAAKLRVFRAVNALRRRCRGSW